MVQPAARRSQRGCARRGREALVLAHRLATDERAGKQHLLMYTQFACWVARRRVLAGRRQESEALLRECDAMISRERAGGAGEPTLDEARAWLWITQGNLLLHERRYSRPRPRSGSVSPSPGPRLMPPPPTRSDECVRVKMDRAVPARGGGGKPERRPNLTAGLKMRCRLAVRPCAVAQAGRHGVKYTSEAKFRIFARLGSRVNGAAFALHSSESVIAVTSTRFLLTSPNGVSAKRFANLCCAHLVLGPGSRKPGGASVRV